MVALGELTVFTFSIAQRMKGWRKGEINSFNYIDRSVLLENTPLVKFIRNYIRDLSGVFSISVTSEDIDDVFSRFSRLFLQTVGGKWRAIDL